VTHYDPSSPHGKEWKLKLKQRLKAKRLRDISERLSVVSPKVDSGRHTLADVQERDRLVEEYLTIEKEIQDDTDHSDTPETVCKN
jgi:hypothetical protein